MNNPPFRRACLGAAEQDAMLEWLVECAAAGKRAPLNREIAARFGLKSMASSARLMQMLETSGRVVVTRGIDTRRVVIVATGAATAPVVPKKPKPEKKRAIQATMHEARPAPTQHNPKPAPFVAESPEAWLARNKPRRAEMVTLDVVLRYLTDAGYAPRRNGKDQDGARYYIKGHKQPLPPRSLVDMANRLRIAADPTATQWIVSGLYAQPAGMLPRDCRPSVLRNAA